MNGVFATICGAIEKLFSEVNVNTVQIKEYFTLIFKVLNYSDKQISKLFKEKENSNNNNNNNTNNKHKKYN